MPICSSCRNCFCSNWPSCGYIDRPDALVCSSVGGPTVPNLRSHWATCLRECCQLFAVERGRLKSNRLDIWRSLTWTENCSFCGPDIEEIERLTSQIGPPVQTNQVLVLSSNSVLGLSWPSEGPKSRVPQVQLRSI